MQKHLTLALVQANLEWENPVLNRMQFSEKISQINKEVDLIILPEMFTTGFSMHSEKIAESMQGETVKWMQEIASNKNVALAGSVVISENNNYYNRFLFVHPSGDINYYNKRHLFTLSGEHEAYTKGDKKILIHFKGWKICPLICYDLRFPVWSRNVEGYDVLLYVANWPIPRIDAWDTLLKARSIENMCYTIGVNRIGDDANKLEYNGHSAVYDFLGKKLTNVEENKENIAIVTLSKEDLFETRNKLNFLADKDIFTL